MTQDTYDVVVIGAGPAGENAAGRCGVGGLRTAVVEGELIGGECSYWGCIPSKVLIRPGDVLAAARRVPGAAQAVTGTIDVAAALARRNEATSGWDDPGQAAMADRASRHAGARLGRLSGPHRVEVTGPDGTVRSTDGDSGGSHRHRHPRGDPAHPRPGDSRAVGQPGHHRGGPHPPPAARPGRRGDRRGDGAGLPPPGQRGGHGRRGGTTVALPRRAVRGRAGGRCASKPKGSGSSSGWA